MSDSKSDSITLSDSEGEEHPVFVGDIIKIKSDDLELAGIWMVEYISDTKMVVIQPEMDKTFTFVIEDGVIQDDRIISIIVLKKEKEDNTGYAIHRDFVPTTWIEIIFDGLDTPIIGQISSLENDSIEVVIFENGQLMTEEPITLDFKYTGLPDGVVSIDIIKDPTMTTPVSESGSSDIEGEELNLQVLRERSRHQFRYGIDEQTNDLLESMMSKLPPSSQMNRQVIANINKNIIRYVQLRQLFSKFDENKNIKQYTDKTEAINKHEDNWKPLKESMLTATQNEWILPIASNRKKIYNFSDDYEDIVLTENQEDISVINNATELYENGDLSYPAFMNTISPKLIPFERPVNISDMFEIKIQSDMDIIIGNNGILSNTYNENYVKQLPFQMNRYVSDINYITQAKLNDSTKTTAFHPLLKSDTAYINSILTLPASVIKHSGVRLPSTNMIDRSNMASTVPMYSKLLNSNTNPTTLTINDIQSNPAHYETFTSNHFKHYSYNNEMAPINYDQFLEYFIPPTSKLIANKSLFSFTDLSIKSMINKLEPYLVYVPDITLTHYNLINESIKQNSAVFFKTLSQYKKLFYSLKKQTYSRGYDYKGTTLVSVIPRKQGEEDITSEINKTIPNKFDISQSKSIVNSEYLLKMLTLDCGNMFHTLCANSILELVSPIMQEDIIDEITPTEKGNCISYVIAKKYKNVEKLQADNGVDEVFFDNEYDNTDYSILNDPSVSKKKFSLSEEEFIAFLKKELMKKIPDEMEVAETINSLLSGHKRVLPGHYAILIDTNYGDSSIYIRENGEWVLAPNAPRNMIDPSFLCNYQPGCSINKNKCLPTTEIEVNAEDNILKNRQNDKIAESIEKHKEMVFDKLIRHVSSILHETASLEHRNNYIKYSLGLDVKMNEAGVSPYAKYVDMIISYPEMKRRYELIISFCSSPIICRVAKPDESQYWIYCATTNTKLIPSFFFQLANAWIAGENEYNTTMDAILNERKAVDDNNVSWIDKYSGYEIRKINFDVDEGYSEEGFKINTRAVLQEDEGEKEMRMLEDTDITVIPVKSRMDYDRDGQYVYGVIDTLSNHMKIDIKTTYGFIIKTAVSLYKSGIMTEKQYKKENSKVPYLDYLLEYLSYITIGVFLIVCQSRTPALKPRGTFPGCVKSFSGFPIGAKEDRSGITYLFCILTKTKFIKVSKNPERLEPYLEVIMQNRDIANIISKRRQFVEVEEVVEHSILDWTSFLPALIPFKLSPPLNVPDDFGESLILDIQAGASSQNDKISVLQSKIILFSYAIQHEIQTLMANEPLILKTYENKQLNANACCNESVNMITSLNYFKAKNSNIDTYNNAILSHRDTLHSVNTITKSIMWLSSEKSKFQSGPLNSSLLSPITVYAGFIKHCNFRNTIMNSPEITAICGEKPQNIMISDTVEEIINKLKQSGKEYTSEQLTPLLQLVSKQVPYVETNAGEESASNPVLNFLNGLGESFEISPIIAQILINCFTEDETQREPAIEELRKYTFNVNARILGKIKSYALKPKKGGFTERDIESFFMNRPRTQVYFQFLKNSITNLCRIFPNMCITGTTKFREKLPAYWGIARSHEILLDSMYNRIFERVVKYYGMHAMFFKHIISSTSIILELVSNIPFLENEVGFLVLEHYLLVVLDIYTTTDENGIQNESIYEEEESEARPTRATVNSVQENIIRDFVITLMGHDKHINVSYQEVVDSAFRLKEREKNILLEKLNNTSDLEVDNHFKNLRIGERWGGGENVRGYDKGRFEQEITDLWKNATTGEGMEDAEQADAGHNADIDGADYDDIDYDNDFNNDDDE